MIYLNNKRVLFSTAISDMYVYNTGFNDGQLDVISKAECLKGSMSGKSITISDISPVTHDITINLKARGQVFYKYCEFSVGGTETYFQEIYVEKTFDPVVGKTYYLETSNSMIGLNDMKYTCTATANDIGGYTLECDDIRIETCSEEYGAWTDSFRITYLKAPQLNIVDFDLKIYTDSVIDMSKVKVIKTNSDSTVSEEYTANADGTVDGVTSIYPVTKLTTNQPNKVVISCQYYKDIDKAYNAK